MNKIVQWYKNLESIEKGILFINIIWILMFISTFLIFQFTTDAFENDLQYREIGLELLQTLKSNFAFVWVMGFSLIGFVDICIALTFVVNRLKIYRRC